MMDDDTKAKPFERLSVAQSTSDLRVEAGVKSDADYIIAAGVVGQRYNIGGALMRVNKGADSKAVSGAAAAVSALVRHMNMRRGWRLSGRSSQKVAEHSLLHHLSPACPHCKGRKFEVAPDTNRLSARMCVPCDGTGIRPLPRKLAHEVCAVLAELQAIEVVVENAVGRLVR